MNIAKWFWKHHQHNYKIIIFNLHYQLNKLFDYFYSLLFDLHSTSIDSTRPLHSISTFTQKKVSKNKKSCPKRFSAELAFKRHRNWWHKGVFTDGCDCALYLLHYIKVNEVKKSSDIFREAIRDTTICKHRHFRLFYSCYFFFVFELYFIIVCV